MVEAYGIKQKKIKKLKEINNNSNNFYNYKDLNFLSKLKKKNKNLVISFHGSLSIHMKGQFDAIFRGFNYEIDNTDILCISDILLTKYKKNYTVSWTLCSKKHFYTDSIYNELFEYLINVKQYKNIIFTGTSAGGFPAIKFASYFKSIALISNSQLYIENYNSNNGLKAINRFLNEDDEVIYENKLIEKIVLKSAPKKIIYYQNTKDNCEKPHSSFKDFQQFKSFLQNNKLEYISELISFEQDGESPHKIQFPDNKKHLKILKDFINHN